MFFLCEYKIPNEKYSQSRITIDYTNNRLDEKKGKAAFAMFYQHFKVLENLQKTENDTKKHD